MEGTEGGKPRADAIYGLCIRSCGLPWKPRGEFPEPAGTSLNRLAVECLEWSWNESGWCGFADPTMNDFERGSGRSLGRPGTQDESATARSVPPQARTAEPPGVSQAYEVTAGTRDRRIARKDGPQVSVPLGGHLRVHQIAVRPHEGCRAPAAEALG